MRLFSLPTNKEDLLKACLGYIRMSGEAWNPYLEKCLKLYKLYRSYVNKSVYPLRSKVFVPISYSVVETRMPRMFDACLYTNPKITLTPRGAVDWDRVGRVSRLINDWMLDADDLEDMYSALKEVAIYGTSFPEFRWSRIYAERDEFEPISPFGEVVGSIKIKRNKMLENRPRTQFRSIFDTLPDWLATGVRDWRFHCVRIVRDKEELLAENKAGINKYKDLNSLEPVNIHALSTGYMGGERTDWKEQREKASGNKRIPWWEEISGYESPILLHEFWTSDRIVTMANHKVIIRDDPNPFGYIPTTICRHTPVPDELPGIGDIEPLETIQFEANDFHNIRMDGLAQSMLLAWLAGESADVEEDYLQLSQGKVLKVGDITQFRRLENPMIDPNVWSGENYILNALVPFVSGVQPYSRGEMPQHRESGVSVMALQKAAERRVELAIKLVEVALWRRFGKFILAAGKQFMMDEYTFAERENPSEKVTRDDFIAIDAETMPVGAVSLVNEQALNSLMSYLAVIEKDPTTSPELKHKVITTIGKLLPIPYLEEVPPQAMLQVQQAIPQGLLGAFA